MMPANDEGSRASATYSPGKTVAVAAHGDADLTLDDDEFDASSQDTQPCASIVSQATSNGLFASINNLRDIMGRCFDGEPLNSDLADWLGEAINGYLTRQFRTLDEGFGLIFPPGGIPWWREEANRERNAALRYFAETFLDDLAISMQAQKIWTEARRYAASAWRFDRDKSEMPTHYANTHKECLWRAFKSSAPMPISERQLRNILAH